MDLCESRGITRDLNRFQREEVTVEHVFKAAISPAFK